MKLLVFDFFKKLAIMVVITLILTVVDIVVEYIFQKDISLYIHFALGYVSCLIWNWRCIFYGKSKEENRS